MPHKLDTYDLKILRILERNGRITKSALAGEIGLSSTATWERLKRLEAIGIIRGYSALVDWSMLVERQKILVQVELVRHTAGQMNRFETTISGLPEVEWCYATGGGVDYIMLVNARSVDDYQHFMDRLLASDIGIERYYSYIVTKAVTDPLKP